MFAAGRPPARAAGRPPCGDHRLRPSWGGDFGL